MPDLLIQTLQDYKISQDINGYEHNINLTSENSLVFCNNDGTVRTYYGTKKIFYRFLEKYGLDKYNIHFHTLRHTFSNMLFDVKTDVKLYISKSLFLFRLACFSLSSLSSSSSSSSSSISFGLILLSSTLKFLFITSVAF